MTNIIGLLDFLEKNDEVRFKKVGIRIRNEKLSFEDTKYIISKMEKFKYVKIMMLQSVCIDPESLDYVLKQLHNTGIQSLILVGVKGLKNDFVTQLATKIQEIPITTINISHNRIESDALIFLFRALNDCGLRELVIDGNKMCENAGYELAKVLNSGTTVLERLSLRYIKFGESIYSFVNSLQNSRIKKLDLSGVKMKFDVVTALCDTLNFTQIEYLDLTRSKLGKKSVLRISELLYDSKLVVLVLDSCDIENVGFLRIVESLNKNVKLQRLSFSDNPDITDSVFDHTLKFATRHVSLNYMSLYRTGMSDLKSNDIMDKMKINRSQKTNILLVLSSVKCVYRISVFSEMRKMPTDLIKILKDFL